MHEHTQTTGCFQVTFDQVHTVIVAASGFSHAELIAKREFGACDINAIERLGSLIIPGQDLDAWADSHLPTISADPVTVP